MGILTGMSSWVGDSWKHDGGLGNSKSRINSNSNQRPLNGSVGKKDQWTTAFTAPLAY